MSQAKSVTRLFVSLTLEDPIKQEVIRLNKYFPQIRFSRNLHLTISFIGNAESAAPYKDILNAISAPQFTLILDTFGYFFNNRSGIVWLAPRQNPILTQIKSDIDANLETLGFKPENRKFQPHITLSRLKNVSRARLAAMLDNAPGIALAWRISKFNLMKSSLTSAGACHEVVCQYLLS